MDSHRNGHRITMAPPLPSRDLSHAMQEHQRELARLERIRLDQPRPDTQRFTNDYVDAPKLPLRTQPTGHAATPRGHHHHGHTNSGKCHDHEEPRKQLDTDHFLTKQPSRITTPDQLPMKKSAACAVHGDQPVKKSPPTASPSEATATPPGIICPECGLCRCSACLTPKPLPSHWLCRGTFECSPANLVDQLSCLCCVRGCFYHIPALSGAGAAATDDEDSAADHPCQCGGGACQRWSVMGLLAVTCLPCLLCYWPCRAAVALAERGYAAHHRRGCRCGQTSAPTPVSSSSSSTESSPVASIRPLTTRKTVKTTLTIPPTRPGHARRIASTPAAVVVVGHGETNGGFAGKKSGVFL